MHLYQLSYSTLELRTHKLFGLKFASRCQQLSNGNKSSMDGDLLKWLQSDGGLVANDVRYKDKQNWSGVKRMFKNTTFEASLKKSESDAS